MEIYLMRHPSVSVEKGICYGQREVALTDNYTDELDRIQAPIPWDQVEYWYASPLPRCRKAIQYLTDASITYDERLMELDFGEWEGKTWSSIDPQQLDQWMQNFYEYPVPGGESYRDLEKRTVRFWKEHCAHPKGVTFIMTHAGVIRTLIAHLLKIPPQRVFSINLDCCGITAVDQNQMSRIQYINRI